MGRHPLPPELKRQAFNTKIKGLTKNLIKDRAEALRLRGDGDYLDRLVAIEARFRLLECDPEKLEAAIKRNEANLFIAMTS